MSDISIRARRREHDERCIAIRNSIAADRPPLTLEEYLHSRTTMPESAQLAEVVAERGHVLGWASWSRRRYTEEVDTFWLEIMVDPDHWGTGIGRALYDHATGAIEGLGAKKIYGQVREDLPDAEAWAARRGFKRTGHGDRISRLDVQKANLVKAREAARHVEASGIRITTLAELGTEDERLLLALKELDDQTSRDIPGEEAYKGPPLDEWKTIMLEAPGMTPETFWIALDGERPVGMAPLERRSAGYADNFYTAVLREYRRRGIARALKLAGIAWAKKNGVRSIVTGNDPANKPMLAINIDLGYQFLPANIRLVNELVGGG